MKYSVGFSNSRGVSKRKSPSKSLLGKSYKPGKSGFDRYKNIKKYASKNLGSKTAKSGAKGRPEGLNKKKWKKIGIIAVGVVFFIGCVILIAAGVYLKKLGNSLPSPNELVSRASDQSTQILDRKGNVLYTVYGDKNREFVSIDKIPEHTRKALLAAEDADFYQHKGIDLIGIARALIQNLRGREVVSGASTLTQQLVKTTLLYDILGDEAYEKTISRKIKEILITMQVEQTFKKDEILQMYMNEVPLGGVNYGFQAGAQAYFGKDVGELTLSESAMLAGLIQSPGWYSPLFGGDPEMAEVRKNYVLGQLESKEKLFGIPKEEIEKAREEPLVYNPKKIDIKAPHFVFYVKAQLEEEFGIDMVEKGGLKVTTTIDPTLQSIAEEELQKGVQSAAVRYNANNGAMIVLDPKTAQILSMVGSVDYWKTDDPRIDGNVNITTSYRQTGSAVKPFVYLSAMAAKGTGPWMVAPDISTITFGNYDPPNWDLKYNGLITARKALVDSRNVPAVYMLQTGGIDNYLQLMQKLGVSGMENKSSYGLSLALGTAEMKMLEFANAYATLANGGVKHDPVSILKVENSKGEVLKENKDDEGKRVIDEKEAYLVNWMICDLQGFGDRVDSRYFNIKGKKVCGKTGTTNGPKDLIAFLYNQSLVVGVWNGNNNNIDMPAAWSTTVSLPLANAFMQRVIDSYGEFNFNRPAGIMTTTVCKDTGATPAEGVDCPKEASIYISGRSPQVDNRKSIEICTADGKIPTNLEIAKQYGLTTTKMLLTTKLDNSAQEEAYRKFLNETGTYIFEMPESGVCMPPLGPDGAPLVEITTPTAGQAFETGKGIEIRGNVVANGPLSAFSITVGGQAIAGLSASTVRADGSFVVNYVVPSGMNGSKQIVVSAKDGSNKVTSKSVAVILGNPSATASINFLDYQGGSEIAKGREVIIQVNGGTQISDVKITLSGYSNPISVSSLPNNRWSILIPNDAQVGPATIKATAMVDGNAIEKSISVTIK